MKAAMKAMTPGGDPGFVMFFTDGEDNEPARTRDMLVKLSDKPVFWQFIGIVGKGHPDFGFLKELDNLKGRVVDNANFFQLSVRDTTDEELYQQLINEFKGYPQLVANSGGRVRW
jgi:hypothetical protein